MLTAISPTLTVGFMLHVANFQQPRAGLWGNARMAILWIGVRSLYTLRIWSELLVKYMFHF